MRILEQHRTGSGPIQFSDEPFWLPNLEAALEAKIEVPGVWRNHVKTSEELSCLAKALETNGLADSSPVDDHDVKFVSCRSCVATRTFTRSRRYISKLKNS